MLKYFKHRSRNLLILIFALSLAACVSGGDDATANAGGSGTNSNNVIDINGTWTKERIRQTEVCVDLDGNESYPFSGDPSFSSRAVEINESFGNVSITNVITGSDETGDFSFIPNTLTLDYSNYGTLFDQFLTGTYEFVNNDYASGTETYRKVFPYGLTCTTPYIVTFIRIS